MLARALGNALCAPIIKLVPEGDIDPPSGHMFYPGTISVRESTFVAVLEDMGITEESEGYHDFFWATAMQMVTDPTTVRYDQRVAAGKASINGVSIASKDKTIRVGIALFDYRVEQTVEAIDRAISSGR